jgi:hypothetical protein
MTYEELLTLRAYRDELVELLNRGEDDNIVLCGRGEGIVLTGKRDLTKQDTQKIADELQRIDHLLRNYVRPYNGGRKPTARNHKPPTQNRREVGKGGAILRDIRDGEKDKAVKSGKGRKGMGKGNVSLDTPKGAKKGTIHGKPRCRKVA